MEPKTEKFGEYAERGEYHRRLDPNWSYYPTYLAKTRFMRALLGKVNPQTAKVLDAGCGEGVLVEEMQKQGYDITGLDADYCSNSVMRGDITEMPFSDRCFTLILCMDVIEHLPYSAQEKALSELNRVLKDDGTVVISVPNLAHLFSRVKFLLAGELIRTANIGKHPGDRPVKEYLNLFRAHGFKIIERKGFFPTFPVFFQMIQSHPSKTVWLYNLVNRMFSYPNWCFLNILVCKKIKLG